MTYLEVNYRYAGELTPRQLQALAELPGCYGILRVRVDEEKLLVCILFDASRLKESEAVHWVRRAGIPLTDKVEVNQPPA
ncbi:MAG: hypothetical protein V3R29_05185 [Candidatus Acidoferrales bacterium]